MGILQEMRKDLFKNKPERKIKPTSEEKKAIEALKKIADKWPKSLWLFSASGSLCVMRRGSNGEQVMKKNGGVDSDFIVDEIDIPNDGGDW
jgi:hypothetical protein